MRFFRKIVGDRLYLSPFDAGDAAICAKWAEWMNDSVVADYYGGYHNLVTPAGAKKTLEGLQGHRFDIVLLDRDEPQHRGKGYGAESVRLALNYGFNALNLHNIMLSVHADNEAAIACYKKVGFNDAGWQREWRFKNGKYVDVLYMDMLAREFNG